MAEAGHTVKTVAVCGATGQQGGSTLRALLKLNSSSSEEKPTKFSIRALTRNPSSSKAKSLLELEPKGHIELFEANFDNPQTLFNAFQGCDAVFAVTDFWQGANMDPLKELEQGKHLVDAAVATGVQHFVFSSLEDTRPIISDLVEPVNGNYTVPHFDAKADIDKYLWQQLPAKSWTSLFPSIFYENLIPGTGSMAPQKEDDGSFLLSLPINGYHMAWCTAEDIGGVAATVIAQGPEVWGGKLLGIVGEYATLDVIAATISKVTGKTVKAHTPSVEE